MKKKPFTTDAAIELRHQAEAKLSEQNQPAPPGLLAETQSLLHELQVHQIELELQNEELRRTQTELQASQSRYFDIYDLAPVGYLILSEKSMILEANLTAVSLLGMARTSLTSYSLPLFILAEDRIIYHQGWRRLIETSSPQTCELRMKRQDGFQFWARLELGIGQDANGMQALRVVLSDISDHKQAEQALREAHALLEQRVGERTADLQAANIKLAKAMQLKDEFLAIMSHELRTPLTGILGLSETLQMRTAGPLNEKQNAYLDHIYNSSQHLLELLNNILDLAKLITGEFELSTVPCSLAKICQSSLQASAAAALAKNLQTSFSMTPDNILLQADARRLKQIILHLLNNAIKFTPPGGSFGIQILGNQSAGQVQITIWDTGIGIKAEDQASLFQPFVQLDARLARHYNGTGLGLSLVQRLTELHGGSVSVESTLDMGSRFTVTLPWLGQQNHPEENQENKYNS